MPSQVPGPPPRIDTQVPATEATSRVPVVLIADNDSGVSELLQEVLRRAGLVVETAADGQIAIDRIARGGIDLLVCDLQMPNLDGHGVLAYLEQKGATLPVFVVSGYVDPRREQSILAHRAVRGVLEKPFDVLEFAERVRRVAVELGA